MGTANPVPDPDDDFADLDAEIAVAIAAKSEKQTLDQKRKRLATLEPRRKYPEAGLEYDVLLSEIRRIEEQFVWHSVSATALFHKQHCATCGAEHRFFMGWMTEQHHKTDKSARRLLKGRPQEELPERTEDHDMGQVEICSDCAESVILINLAAKGNL